MDRAQLPIESGLEPRQCRTAPLTFEVILLTEDTAHIRKESKAASPPDASLSLGMTAGAISGLRADRTSKGYQRPGGARCYPFGAMAKGSHQHDTRGPFRAERLRPGVPYELSNGHPIHCLPKGSRGGRAANVGGGVLASDPAALDVGVKIGFSPSAEILRAPDLSVGEMPDEPGWVQGAPPLAIEYADTGQDEAELRIKIQELFAAGTRFVWVVRLVGPRRVEVHQAGERMRIANPGEQLTAPGILANPVPVEALYDREAANRVIFRNLLERQGYASLDDVRAEGEVHALRKAIAAVLAGRGLPPGDELRIALADANDLARLESVLRLATTASTTEEVLAAFRA